MFLLIGGLFGLSIALTRWPAVHLLPADWFYLALTAHGFDVLLVWIIFFEMAVLYFASAVLLNCRLAAPRWAWAQFGLMLVGALMTNVAVLQGNSSVMFTSYPPLQASPWFYLGLILFAVGRADRLRRVLRHAGHRQGREDLRGLGAAGDLRRDHRGDHRGVHARLGRDHPDPDLALVARAS